LGSTTNGGDPDNNIDNDNNGINIAGASRSLSVTLAAGTEPTTDGDDANGNLTVDFGMFKTASLGDFVWVDGNQNGVQDAGEPGLTGVTVTLKNAAGTVVGTTTTSATGAYSFTGLAIGTYTVTFTTPAGYTASPSNVTITGATDANDSDPIAGVVTVSLANQQINNTIDAGFYLAPTPTGSIGNYVWNDGNGNGIQDATEVGLSGVQIQLKNAAGTIIATTTSNASGFYQFTGLAAGTYTVQFLAVAGFGVSPANQGTNDAIDSDVNGSGNSNIGCW
jgi:hypothetical protein